MEKAISICELGAQSFLIVLTDSGRIYAYKQSAQPGAPGTWGEIVLPPAMGIQEIELAGKINASGRLPNGYELYKRNDNQLFYWERQEDGNVIASEPFERMEGAIASARNDWMVRTRPHPPSPQPEPEPVP